MFNGHLVITRDYPDGRSEVVVDEDNYVLLYPRAYHLFQMYHGGLINDPIQTYQLGRGGFVNNAVVSSAGTNITNSVFIPLSCLSETITTQIYDKTRLAKDVEYTPPVSSTSPTSVTYSFYLDLDEAVGQEISEAGLKTVSDHMFCHRTFPTIVKTSEFRLSFTWRLKV